MLLALNDYLIDTIYDVLIEMDAQYPNVSRSIYG